MARLNQRLGLTRFEADEYYKQALQAYDKRELDAAILAMEEAINLLPSPEYLAARGLFYLADGIEDKAAADFDAALQQHTYETLAHYGKGVIAYRHKAWTEAIEHFNAAFRSDPDRGETLYYLALAYHHSQNNRLALAYMQRALDRFEEAGDKRRTDANKWIKTLERLAEGQKENPRLG